ncbi:aldehyde dehydrogenase family protein [Novosphingobium percolationis]|uniref:aldehyde dehydrogenase family protein n=1 Tax=Novosphingobium percolationis TaxID=2871811 RepID=UPI001CD20751|nr:aldehyde dehydrogenase family protein [Novosphingobium percolationis]
MADATRFYIDGQWVAPSGDARAAIVNPADRSVVGEVALGTPADAEAAIAAARAAFPAWSASTREERLTILEKINAALIARADEIGDAIMAEMGAPLSLARGAQAGSGPQHFGEVIRVLKDYPFETPLGSTLLQREAIGVCVLITPWNWPINQIATKVAPALAAGCTMVLKPSEVAPLDAAILAEIIEAAGVPKGVFNLVHGSGPEIGNALTGHPDVDMVSFTGSTRAGVAIATNAAPTIKRVALELGGKSACIVLPDADFAAAIPATVRGCMLNTGQSCNAPTRLLVPRARLDEACALAKQAAEAIRVGLPTDDPDMGPVANAAQYARVIAMIEQAVAEGATLLTGGATPPAGLEGGLFVPPTIFRDVTPAMTIAREEVFGPVLAVLAYDSVDEAVALANDSPYGLSGYVWGASMADARAVARRLRTGMVHLNGASLDSAAPFGGYRMSGNGREWGRFGLEEFLEVKSIYGGAEA